MYLKSIEIQGFKSFANKMIFEFHNGITAIVGPNGSGKSNVADAVRWVLGEQRVKQLRGSSMQDVIFSGTELRKPLSFAYVAITLDNSDHKLPVDYDEVTVARRIYRSGESEYLMNGSTCRLRDVNELFYDTGIGKEGYSIIGQGQIDKILSDRPEDRRELFDEAVGIVKFKRRKEASLKKLESEKANLVRITDILTELERQVGPLEKQAEKARVYLRTREQLKTVDVNAFLLENAKAREDLADVTQKATVAKEDLERSQREMEEVRAQYDTLQEENEALEKTIEETRAEITRTDVVRGKLESDIKVYEEQIRSAKSNTEHFTQRREAVHAQVEERRGEMESYRDADAVSEEEVAKIEAQRDAQQAALDSHREEMNALSEEAETLRGDMLALLDTRAAIRSRAASLETMGQQADIRKSELTSRLVTVQSDETKQDEIIRQMEETFAKITEEIGVLQEKQRATQDEIDGCRTQLTDTDAELQKAQLSFHKTRSKLEALQNLTERYEGFGHSVKRVMEHKGSERGLIGVVADLIKTEEKYETAIEVALGGSIQNVVTRDEETARRMIDMLKRERAGRATFLPLTAIKDPQKLGRPEVLREKGAIGTADTVVTCDPAYRSVAESLLGRIVVVDTFDHAVAIQRKYNSRIRMVTLEGELFAPGGAISGGTFRDSSNLLSRRRELAMLGEQADADKAMQEKLLQKIEDIKKNRNHLRMELENARMELQQKIVQQNTARLNVVREKEKKTEYVGSYEQLRDENREVSEQIGKIEEEKKQIQADLEESKQKEQESGERVAQIEALLTDMKKKEDELSLEVRRQDIEVEKARQAGSFTKQNLTRATEELERLSAEEQEIVRTLEETSNEIAEKTENIKKIRATIESSHTAQADQERRLKEATARREELTRILKESFEKRDSLSDLVRSLDKEHYRLTSQKEKLEEQIEHKAGYIWDEYELTISEAETLRDAELSDLPALKRQVQSLKGQIRALGPVNVGAIEEYREVSERYTFLKGQHDDLVKAEETLQGIIDELDASMRKQFAEQFEHIRTEFDKVFKVLFGGGKGTLELVEDEDILEAGIRVIAQPPGKKLQNMMQLSGGEKSLAAIALLFAIQNLKPSPFCLLDEIEAALDENNVVRFADYLHKLTNNTQFIVITHRRGTMERADRLYGITMQEKGVSTMVSVNLIDKDLTA